MQYIALSPCGKYVERGLNCYRRERDGMFAHVDEHDADGEGQGEVLGERADAGVGGDATSRQVDVDVAVARRYPDRFHLVLTHLERQLVTRADRVDAVLHSTDAELALTAHQSTTHTHRSLNWVHSMGP